MPSNMLYEMFSAVSCEVWFISGKHLSVGASGSHGVLFRVLEKLEPIDSQNVNKTPTIPPESAPL